MMKLINDNYGCNKMLEYLYKSKHIPYYIDMPANVWDILTIPFKYTSLTTFDYTDMLEFINSGYTSEAYIGHGTGNTKYTDALNEVSKKSKHTKLDVITMRLYIFAAKTRDLISLNEIQRISNELSPDIQIRSVFVEIPELNEDEFHANLLLAGKIYKKNSDIVYIL